MGLDIFDTDRSGSINFMEFEGLYRYIQVGTGFPTTRLVAPRSTC
jgi:hypothetical protein